MDWRHLMACLTLVAGAAWAQPTTDAAAQPPAAPGSDKVETAPPVLQPPAPAQPPPPPLTRMRIALGAPRVEHAPFYWALKQGGYKDAGIAPGMVAGGGAERIAQQVGAGRLALGVVDLGTALQASAQGLDVVAVMNLYGQALIANRAYLAEQGDAVRGFVRATQLAFADCAKNPEPCTAHYARARRQGRAEAAAQWRTTAAALGRSAQQKTFGVFHPDAIRADYQALVGKGARPGFDVSNAYSNAYLDPAVKLP